MLHSFARRCGALLAVLSLFSFQLLSAQDSTALVQNAINALPPYGVIDCGGASYMVGRVNLKSRMTIKNCNFTTSPSSIPFTVPMTMDGSAAPISEVTILNV